MRSTPKRSAARGTGRFLLRVALGLSLALLAGVSRAESGCEGFSLTGESGAPGPLASPGVETATPRRLDPDLVRKGTADGTIRTIAADGPVDVMNRVGGEALLVLPKLPGGQIADDFTLGADAQIVDSFWSSVLCATIVRVRGPRDARPEDLVPRVAPPAVVLSHSRYRTTAAKVRAVKPKAAAGPDPYRPLQHGLTQLGVMQARSRSNGRGVRVAILDSAPDVTHRELANVRLVAIENGPSSAPALHGTLVAGLIAATEGNAFGIVGVAPGADVIAIPVCSPLGAGTSDECNLFDVIRGIDVAWKQGATILNLSLAGAADPLLHRAVTRLLDLGTVVVAAAGNGASTIPNYPAAYPGVIGVGAVDPIGQPYAEGSHGPWVSISGPGVEVLSTIPGDSFAFVNGTSLAAAQVTGALALLAAVVPDPVRMRMALLATARAALGPAAGTPVAPPVCDVLRDVGMPCGTRATTP